jgi:hypothetical protein
MELKFEKRKSYKSGHTNVLGIPATIVDIYQQRYKKSIAEITFSLTATEDKLIFEVVDKNEGT